MSQTTTLSELKRPSAQVIDPTIRAGFDTVGGFDLIQRTAKLFASSSIVPKQFQGNLPNCVIAVDMALRMGANPLMVCQNLYIVHERPAWSAQFLIATLNQCGRFSSIRYEFQGEEGKDEWGCRAVATELTTKEKLTGPLVTIGLAKKEGWYGKTGSKWQAMPELMLRYRAASWFVRAHAPEIAMGLKTADEVQDTYDLERTEDGTYRVSVQEMQETKVVEATTQAAEQPKRRPTKEEIEALRAEAVVAWEDTGKDISVVEKTLNAYCKNWTKAQCEKVMQLAAKAMQSGTSQPASSEDVPPEGEAGKQPKESAGNMFTCPKTGANVSDWTCSDCDERTGCPAWE